MNLFGLGKSEEKAKRRRLQISQAQYVAASALANDKTSAQAAAEILAHGFGEVSERTVRSWRELDWFEELVADLKGQYLRELEAKLRTESVGTREARLSLLDGVARRASAAADQVAPGDLAPLLGVVIRAAEQGRQETRGDEERPLAVILDMGGRRTLDELEAAEELAEAVKEGQDAV